MWSKPIFISGLIILATALPLKTAAQQQLAKKDSLKMSCLLLDATQYSAEKQSSLYDAKELKLILSSQTDTTVKACADGVVSTVQRDEDGKFEIVFYHNDYWFWLSGVSKAIVKPRQKIKSGQAIGILEPGQKIELLLFDFETPVDPKNYLDCPTTK